MEIEVRDLKLFLEVIAQKSGLKLSADKGGMLSKRLVGLMQRANYHSFIEFLSTFETSGMNQLEVKEVFNFVTTQETYFFRLPRQFEYLLTQIIPEFVSSGRRNLKILSAGCATGEEPYSLAIVFEEWNEKNPDKQIKFEVTGVDISEQAIEFAKKGCYSFSSVKRVQTDPFAWCMIEKWIDKRTAPDGATYEISPELKSKVKFQFMNLLNCHQHFVSGFFDLVFFRNVLIYMSDSAREQICGALFQAMSLKGHLFLGETESPSNEDDFEMIFAGNTYFFKKDLITMIKR